MDIIKEAIVTRDKFGYITEGDRVFVIKIDGALFYPEDTISGERKEVRLREPKYYVLKSIHNENREIDWSRFVYVMNKEDLKFLNK